MLPYCSYGDEIGIAFHDDVTGRVPLGPHEEPSLLGPWVFLRVNGYRETG